MATNITNYARSFIHIMQIVWQDRTSRLQVFSTVIILAIRPSFVKTVLVFTPCPFVLLFEENSKNRNKKPFAEEIFAFSAIF